MEQGFRDIAHNPQTPEIEKNTKAVKQWLARVKEEWLPIFNNVIADFLPEGVRGNLLFTSRNREIRHYTGNSHLEVKEMDEDEAINLLLKAANEARAHAKPIVKALHYLTLATDQAGAYIGNECSLDDYLHVCSARRKSLLEDHMFKGSFGYRYAVYGTWELSFQAIKDRANNLDNLDAEAASDALVILQVFAFFHHDGILEEIFRLAAGIEKPEPYSAAEDPHGEFVGTGSDLPTQLLLKKTGSGITSRSGKQF